MKQKAAPLLYAWSGYWIVIVMQSNCSECGGPIVWIEYWSALSASYEFYQHDISCSSYAPNLSSLLLNYWLDFDLQVEGVQGSGS